MSAFTVPDRLHHGKCRTAHGASLGLSVASASDIKSGFILVFPITNQLDHNAVIGLDNYLFQCWW